MSDRELPFRIVYHPAPGPGPNGSTVTPEPIVLGSDLESAVRWIRRRHGMSLDSPLPRPAFNTVALELTIPEEPPVRVVRGSVKAEIDAARRRALPEGSKSHRSRLSLPHGRRRTPELASPPAAAEVAPDPIDDQALLVAVRRTEAAAAPAAPVAAEDDGPASFEELLG